MGKSKKSKRSASDDKQTIEHLTDRFNKLKEDKIKAETNLKHAQTQLNDLEKKAEKDYGTDDLKKLKDKLKQLQAENETKRTEYQDKLDGIESELAGVKEKYEESADFDDDEAPS